MKHRIEIRVCDGKNKSKTVLSGGEMPMSRRLISKLLGKRRMLVLVPADDVLSVAIREVSEE